MMRHVLDVRSPEQFAAGHAAGAGHIPHDELSSRMHELPEKGAGLRVLHDDPAVAGQAVELLCARGYRAEIATAMKLDDHGPAVPLWRPSAFLMEALPLMGVVKGRAVDLGCGSGREAVWLARQGWDVDAFDILPDAIAKASDLARRNGVKIGLHTADAEKTNPPRKYDLLCCFRYLPRRVLGGLGTWIVPGGYVVVESFHRRDAESRMGGRNVQGLLGDGELVELARGFDMIIARDQVQRGGRWYSQLLARLPYT
jgi:SAM-dependent methyltransferase